MNLHWIDWTIVIGLLVFITSLAIYVKRYTRSVAGFLSANRCAGRYLLSTAEGISSLGAISMVAVWSMYYQRGFATTWWQMMALPVGIVLGMTGFVIYRYRETRSLTVGQFFEKRYSKKFRIFAQILAFISGVLNFGIFPAVGARFFIYYINLPEQITIGSFHIQTFLLLMILLVGISLFFTFLGGQIAVIVTDFVQGLFCNIVFLSILIALFAWMINWGQVKEALLQAPPGKSMVNPMDMGDVHDFNFWYSLIAVVGAFYAYMSWQGSQGYNSSARTPHEAKMSKIVSGWRNYAQLLLMILLPIAVYTIMHNAAFSDVSSKVNEALNGIDNSYIKKNMTVPIALAHFMPIGLRGAICAVVLAAFISTHDTYLHSWGSIFVQDVVMPFRKKPFEKKTHMFLLRASIIGVAIFIVIYSYFYKVSDQILMYFALTGAIYLGGAGAVLIGGLYWKRGTTLGAYGAMIVGSVLGLGALYLRQWGWQKMFGQDAEFPINGQWMYAITMGSSTMTYVVLSLIENKVHNMDKLFHRGEYKIESDHIIADGEETKEEKLAKIHPFWQKLGVNEEFTKFDKFIFFASVFWTLLWWFVFLIGTAYYYLVREISDDDWMKYWVARSWIFFAVAVICTVWVGIGGVRDLILMFKSLSISAGKDEDDGFVRADGSDGTDIVE